MGPSRMPLVVVVAVAVLLGAAAGASAQLEGLENTTPEQRAAAQTAFMKRKLALTAEQLPKVEALNLGYARKMEPVIKGSSGPLMKMREAKEINEAKDAELKGVLTPDQYAKYLAAREEMRDEIVEKMKERAR